MLEGKQGQHSGLQNKKRAIRYFISEEREQNMFANHSTKGTIFHKKRTLPRSIPKDVLSRFDMLLAHAMHKMERGQDPGILKPVYWDAILILRRTGILFEDLVHL